MPGRNRSELNAPLRGAPQRDDLVHVHYSLTKEITYVAYNHSA